MGVARHRARLALVCAVAMIGAACSSPPEESSDDTTNAASSTSTEPSSTTSGQPQVTYERPTVDPPGELEARIVGDDLLVVGSDTLPEELVEQIGRIKVRGEPGVAAMHQFSLTQIPVENKVFDVAAVDPRRIGRSPCPTARCSSSSGTGWPAARWPSLSTSRAGSAGRGGVPRVRHGGTTHKLHVGAYGQQVGTIDAVVNGLGRKPGLVRGNALVISTGAVSPQAVNDRLAKLIDKRTSVYGLDAVGSTVSTPGRPGRSPQSAPSPRRWGSSATRSSAAVAIAARGLLGPGAHRHRDVASSRHGDVQQGDDAAATSGDDRHPGAGASATRSTTTSAATTRASSPAPPRFPTTRSASRSTSTRSRTSAERSVRWTRCRRDLQEVGLRLGWRLELHRPHALRAGGDRPPRLSPGVVRVCHGLSASATADNPWNTRPAGHPRRPAPTRTPDRDSATVNVVP